MKYFRISLKFCVLVILSSTPSIVLAASSSAFIDGSSESTSALIEGANVEQQINRINVGISLVRINTVILYEMPISGDSTWVDELTIPMTSNMYVKVRKSAAVRNDPYFSTAMITNMILRRPALDLTPLNSRLYFQLNTIYKNNSNEHKQYSIPDIYELPNFQNMDTFITFGTKNNGKRVAKIEVEAAKFEKFVNVESAVISLTPKKYQKDLLYAKEKYQKAKKELAKVEGLIKSNEAWLSDDVNIQSKKRKHYKEITKKYKETITILKINLAEADEEYTKLIDEAAVAIESFQSENYLIYALPLAQKLEKLLHTVDNNAIGALSMFTIASTHLVKNGLGTLKQEIEALTLAKSYTMLVGNQKTFLIQRLSRMGKGALMAMPNIFIGVYYATQQVNEVSRYQTIVNKVLEIDEATKKETGK